MPAVDPYAAEDVKSYGDQHQEEELDQAEQELQPLVNPRKRKPSAHVCTAPEDSDVQRRPRKRGTSWKEHGRKHMYIVACYHPVLTPEIDEIRQANGAYSYRWEIYVEREQLRNGLRRGRRYFLDTKWEDATLFNDWATG